MNIDPRNNPSHFFTAQANRQRVGAEDAKASSAQKPTIGHETISLRKYADKLASEPEVRPEVVAKGKELLNDPNFPSKEVVDSIAKLIVPFADED